MSAAGKKVVEWLTGGNAYYYRAAIKHLKTKNFERAKTCIGKITSERAKGCLTRKLATHKALAEDPAYIQLKMMAPFHPKLAEEASATEKRRIQDLGPLANDQN